ncbi:hypothetical protein [Kitasatospora sp. NPDC088346]|uniref:hypothetical protein n=1 Tax=Kitasatospora sp. NPDC088346 TaxID=3364073 RepID=UPI00380E6B2D
MTARAGRTGAALSVAGLVAMSTLVAAPAAHAGGYGCTGNLSWSGKVTDYGGNEAGWVYDYWNGSQNCSVVVKTEFAGIRSETQISIVNNRGVHGGFDHGGFTTYAGPVSVDGVDACVNEHVTMFNLDNQQIVNWSSGWHSGPGC